VDINLTLLGQMGTFFVLVWVTMKYIWPPIMKAMADRQQTIADGLAAAERGRKEQELAEVRVTEVIKEARDRAADIIVSAEKRSTQIVEEAKDTAKVEGERILSSARSEIDQQINRARETLRGQVAALTVSGAGQILGREIDDQAHVKLLDELVAEL
jgi:F-type H+-transporting ATPase subunit b